MVRLKHRYIIAQVFFLQRHLQQSLPISTSLSNFGTDVTRNITHYRILETIKQKIQELYGEMGMGDFGQQIVIKYYEQEYSKLLIIKVPRGYQNYVQFVLSTISSIDDIPLVIRTINLTSCTRTTGNKIKEVMEAYIKQHERQLDSTVTDRLIQTAESALQEN